MDCIDKYHVRGGVELNVPVSIYYVTRTNTQERSMHGSTCCHKCPVTLSSWVLNAGSVPTTGVVPGVGGVATRVGLLALKGGRIEDWDNNQSRIVPGTNRS